MIRESSPHPPLVAIRSSSIFVFALPAFPSHRSERRSRKGNFTACAGHMIFTSVLILFRQKVEPCYVFFISESIKIAFRPFCWIVFLADPAPWEIHQQQFFQLFVAMKRNTKDLWWKKKRFRYRRRPRLSMRTVSRVNCNDCYDCVYRWTTKVQILFKLFIFHWCAKVCDKLCRDFDEICCLLLPLTVIAMCCFSPSERVSHHHSQHETRMRVTR